jgi:diguanylate cyclase
MGLIIRKKDADTPGTKELSKQLQDSEERRDFFLLVIRALLVFIKDYSLDIKEINAEGFKKRIDNLTGRFISVNKQKTLQSAFEKHKKIILSFIKRQKEYLRDREKEFRDIIDLLTKGMASVDAENQIFNQKIYKQSEKIEKITLLDDIKKIKTALKHEIEKVRETIREKQTKDREQLEVLTRQVEALNVDLEKAKEESMKDGLTGVYNRLAFDRYMKNLEERNTVTQQPFSILVLDIDDFKVINDTYGHTIGDRVILALIQKCTKVIRKEDFLARYGGDEFVIVLPNASLKNASKKAGSICKSVAATRYALSDVKEGLNLSFTVSIGVSAYEKGDTTAAVTDRADNALYLAKKSGKGLVFTERDLE